MKRPRVAGVLLYLMIAGLVERSRSTSSTTPKPRELLLIVSEVTAYSAELICKALERWNDAAVIDISYKAVNASRFVTYGFRRLQTTRKWNEPLHVTVENLKPNTEYIFFANSSEARTSVKKTTRVLPPPPSDAVFHKESEFKVNISWPRVPGTYDAAIVSRCTKRHTFCDKYNVTNNSTVVPVDPTVEAYYYTIKLFQGSKNVEVASLTFLWPSEPQHAARTGENGGGMTPTNIAIVIGTVLVMVFGALAITLFLSWKIVSDRSSDNFNNGLTDEAALDSEYEDDVV